MLSHPAHRLLVACALLTLPALAAAQQTDVIRGRVTNEEGLALRGVRVSATAIPGATRREARTDDRGNFQIVFPNGTGDYMMGYALIGYLYRQHQVKRLADEDVLISNASLVVMQLDTVAVVAPLRQRVRRNESGDATQNDMDVDLFRLNATERGDLAAMAASLPGVLLVPGVNGAPDGFSVYGLSPDQNTITLNGLQFDASGLPRDANISASMTTASYDAARGGFSGANLNIASTASGMNLFSVTRGMSLVFNTPRLQWTDRAGRALGSEFTDVSVGGAFAGPLSRERAGYTLSFQLGRNLRDNQTLLRTSPLGLQTAGVASDSVSRLLAILQQQRVPGTSGIGDGSRVSDNGSLLGGVSYSPIGSASGQTLGFTFHGNWGKQSPVTGGPTELASASGDRLTWSGGLQAQHTAYYKLILTESEAGLTVSRNRGDAYLDLPSGRVRVNSAFADGSNGVQSLTFGGNQGLASSSRSLGATFRNTLSWFDGGNKHRVKLATELQVSSGTLNPASNALGTFTFNSLEDLEAGIPASFSRTLRVRERETGHMTAALSLGDSYRRSADLQLQYGVRLDATRYGLSPEFNPAVLSTFGRRNDRVPNPIAISPRIGFSWTLGELEEVGVITGMVRPPRALLRGGIGLFASTADGAMSAAVDNTGLPSGTTQLQCVGAAAPLPDWDAYAADPSAIPTACADGTTGTVFSNAAPNVVLFAPGYRPPRSLRTNVSWLGPILDNRIMATLDASYSLNLNQSRQVDLNFNGVERFALGIEGRPVFVAPSSIVAATGSIASADGRVSNAFARVTDMVSDLESRAAQFSVRITPRPRIVAATRTIPFHWSAGYTYSHIREKVSGFTSTAGSPLGVEWARSAQGPHQFTYNVTYTLFRKLLLGWTGTLRSGAAFTPMIAGDVNGDGYANDRAFVFSPATAADPAVSSAMAQLLAGSTDEVRDCLARQLDRIAGRNSCRGSWISTGALNVSVDRATLRLPYRTVMSLAFSNPLGAADLLINGSDNLRGWGQPAPAPDPQLLYVRGFDPATQRYRYEVNQRFGAARPRYSTLRSPVMVTMSFRIDLGPTRERQMIEEMVRRPDASGYRIDPGYWRASRTHIPNPIGQILAFQDTIRLSTEQADSIAVLNRAYVYSTDSLWAAVGVAVTALGPKATAAEVYEWYMRGRSDQIELLLRAAPGIKRLLSSEQRRRLSAYLLSYLDGDNLKSMRGGTPVFTGRP